jgi:hypothetical protein
VAFTLQISVGGTLQSAHLVIAMWDPQSVCRSYSSADGHGDPNSGGGIGAYKCEINGLDILWCSPLMKCETRLKSPEPRFT